MDDRRVGERDGRPDLRMAWLATAAWAGGLVGLRAPGELVAFVLAGALVVLLASLRRPLARPTRTATVLVLCAVTLSGWARGAQTGTGPVADLAAERASVQVVLSITSDARPTVGGFEEQVVLRGTVREVTGRGGSWRVRSPVVVLADPSWSDVPLGATVRLRGRLLPADDEVAALLRVRGGPTQLDGPDVWWRGAAVVRAGIREAVAPRPEDQRVLVPSLVVGDDAGLDPDLADEFRTTGLTHLLAVSGTNLTLMVGFLLLVGRWLGVRGRGRHVVAVLGIVGFVLLARTEPSVVRAAAMGSIALLAFTSNGRSRGIRTLGVAVVALLLVEPRLAVTVGFALSVLATAGILLLAPDWAVSLRRWLPARTPRGVAEALAVPAAAQLACTPVVAALSGEVSLAAVLANLLVAPAVAPATVLGLAGGICAVFWPALGQLVAWPAAWSVGWIIAVAGWGAGLPRPAVTWGTDAWSLAALTAACVAMAVLAPRVLARPVPTVLLTVLALLAVLVRPPVPGWPPSGWVLALCDVGQGDTVVLRAGEGSAVVVDAGPEPTPVARCLDRLGVEQVPLLVLTHFHLDHVGGVAGVLSGRTVGEVHVSPLAAPVAGAARVSEELAGAGLAPSVGPHLALRQVGDVRLQQVWPLPGTASGGPPDPEDANDASVVLVAEVRGVRVLLTGDVEPPAQRRLARMLPELRVDVLKVPHHGSGHQDPGFLTSVCARIALVPVGADNDYGHPAPSLLRLLEGTGAAVLRTDTSGDLAVLERDGELHTATSR